MGLFNYFSDFCESITHSKANRTYSEIKNKSYLDKPCSEISKDISKLYIIKEEFPPRRSKEVEITIRGLENRIRLINLNKQNNE